MDAVCLEACEITDFLKIGSQVWPDPALGLLAIEVLAGMVAAEIPNDSYYN